MNPRPGARFHGWVQQTAPATTAGLADLMFVDGEHRWAEVERDVALLARLLKPGGVWAFHDYGEPTWPRREAVRQPVRRPARPAGPLGRLAGSGANRMNAQDVTLSIVVPTIGRSTLTRTLASIKAAGVDRGDEVIVVADGRNHSAKNQAADFGKVLRVLYEEVNSPAEDFGGTPRTLGMLLASKVAILFMDDDDYYNPDTFGEVRRAIADLRRPTPVLFRMNDAAGRVYVWKNQSIVYGNVSSQIIAVPNLPRYFGAWGKHYAGDFDFIQSTVDRFGFVAWSPVSIATSGGINSARMF